MLDDTTTTVETEESTAGATPQAESTTENAAEGQETQTQTDPQKGAAESTDDNVDWLKNKGIDPSDPEALSKAAAMYRNAEKQMHEATQGAADKLRDAATEATTTGDEVTDRVSRLETELQVTRFYQKHPDAEQLDTELAELVQKKPWLAQDLEDAYTIVKAGKSDAALKAAEAKGREQAKQEIAKASTAGTPTGNASSPKSEKTAEEARLERFSNW